MPTYEFRCPNGHEFEKFYGRISESVSELPCPECGATAVRQISGGAGLLFKGSGFYLTDYGKNAHRGGTPAAAGKESAAGGEGAKSESKSGESKSSESKPAESKTEAKPAAKPAPKSGDS